MPRGCTAKPDEASKRKHKPPKPKDAKPTKPNAASNVPIQPVPSDSANPTGPSRKPENANTTNLHHPASVIPQIMEFFLLNVQGINPNVIKQKLKIKAMEEEVNNSDKIIPFFAATETHLNENIFDAEVQIRNYSIIRSDRALPRKQGGVALYLHHTIAIDDTMKFSDQYTEAVAVYIKKSKLLIIVTYRAPNTPIASFRSCLQSTKEFIQKYDGSDIIALGDYNFRFIQWSTETLLKTSVPVEEQDQATMFLNFTQQHLLTQIVKENTRNNLSILDLILTTDPEMIHNVNIEKTNSSDHDIVRCNFVHTHLQMNKETTFKSLQQKHPLDNLNFGRANWSAINEDFLEVDWDSEMADASVEQMYKTLETHIINTCVKHTPVRTRITQTHKIPNKRLALLRKKKRLNHKINLRKYVSNNNSQTLIQRLEAKKAAVEKEISESIKAENEKKEIEAIEKMKRNPKMFFTYVKKFKNTDSKIGPLSDNTGKIHTDSKTKANLLQTQYTQAFSDPGKSNTDHIKLIDERDYPNLEDIDFTPEDVIKAIDSIPSSSAPGPDKLPAAVLKSCKETLSYPIYRIWRKSLDTADIPEMLKSQSIIPIFKKGNRAWPANYRPVSLTSHLIKLFERVLVVKIVLYIEDNKILTDQQHGFRPHRNCLTQLLVHIDNILKIAESDNNADVVYIDFAKAFDKVDHKILLYKIKNLGIQGKIYNWIESFLTNRHQQVIVDGEVSESREVKSGVPQGTVLGPVLFLLFINDITEAIKFANIQCFADDCKLTLEIENENDHQKLQQDIEAAIMWSLLNNMELNMEKFQLLHHGHKEELKTNYTLDSKTTLKPSTHVKDLGVTVSEELAWRKHITNVTNEGKKFTFWILRSFKTRSTVLLHLFKSFVISKLEYASPLWMPHMKTDIEKIEALQRTLTSRLDGMENLNYHERLKMLKIYSLQRRRERFAIITVWKIMNDLHPNHLKLDFYDTPRFGTKCRRPISKAKRLHTRTLYHNSFASKGPALFNTIPRKVREKETLSSFKSALDNHLKTIPDAPPISGYPFLNGNSILEWSGSGHRSLGYGVDADTQYGEASGSAGDSSCTF